MKQLEIERLKFETENETVELLKIVVDGYGDRRIVGYSMMGGVTIKACSWSVGGTPMNGTYSKLIPVDKFKNLKQAFKDGAIMEARGTISVEWLLCTTPSWYETSEYRIKGDITISKWKVHKEVIKAFWDGSEIQYKDKCGKCWLPATSPTWYTVLKYRVKSPTQELSIAEISEMKKTTTSYSKFTKTVIFISVLLLASVAGCYIGSVIKTEVRK